MNIFVLFGQRKCSYPGEYAVEALDCADENLHSENPSHLEGMLAKYEKSEEFDRLKILMLAVNEADIRKSLYPEARAIKAEVIVAGTEE